MPKMVSKLHKYVYTQLRSNATAAEGNVNSLSRHYNSSCFSLPSLDFVKKPVCSPWSAWKAHGRELPADEAAGLEERLE
jgi:hypothetical protein